MVSALIHPIAFIKAVYRTFFREGVSVQAAGLAFKTLLSLIPLGIVVATVYAVVQLDAPAAKGESEAPRAAAAEAAASESPEESKSGDGDKVDSLGRLRGFIDDMFVPDQARKATEWIENGDGIVTDCR